jgi:hypothetical protein
MASVNEKQFTPKYGRPGSKSAAMEYALHMVDTQPKDVGNEPVPVVWSVGESITQIGEVVDVTLKVDGQSATYYCHKNRQTGEWHTGICSRSLEMKPECNNINKRK